MCCRDLVPSTALFLRITSCHKAVGNKVLHGEIPHPSSFKIDPLFCRALACIVIFGTCLLPHIGFCPMIVRSTATHIKQEHEESDTPFTWSMLLGVLHSRLTCIPSPLRS